MRPSPSSVAARPPATSDDAHFHSETDEFLRWFLVFPGTTFSDSIQIVDLRWRNAGRGIVATTDIPADAVLFTIPRGMILNAETFPQQPRQDALLRAFHSEHSAAGPWPSMIMMLMAEWFEGERSRFAPYLDVLPTRFETPMFWSEGELAELQASAARGKIGKEDAERMFGETIVPFVRGHGASFEGSEGWSDEELVGLAHRMGSTLMAYAFDLEGEKEREKEKEREEDEEWEEDEEESESMMGMVPMADILNADAEFNAHVVHEPTCLTVRSLRPIKTGEEVLNYYGAHPNSELLRRYGYVSAKHARYDVVELPWSSVEAAVSTVLDLTPEQAAQAHQLLVSKIEDEGGELEDAFVLERQCDDPNPDGTFPNEPSFAGAPDELDEQLKMLLKAVRKLDSSLAAPEKRKREHVHAAAMLAAIAAVEARYPTSLVDDERLLREGEGAENVPARMRMAAMVRWGEKKLLREARDFYAAADGDEDVDMGGDEGNHKRRRRD